MVYIVKQKISGRDYYYIRKSIREGKKVKSKNVIYGGKTREEAEEKLKNLKIDNDSLDSKELKPSVKITIDELANFCKAKGFIFPSSEIYGGISGFWDFGPLGVELFNNIRQDWWNFL